MKFNPPNLAYNLGSSDFPVPLTPAKTVIIDQSEIFKAVWNAYNILLFNLIPYSSEVFSIFSSQDNSLISVSRYFSG